MYPFHLHARKVNFSPLTLNSVTNLFLAQYMDYGLHRLAVLVSIRIWLSCRKNNLEMGVWHWVFVFPGCRSPHYLFYGRDVRLHSPFRCPAYFS